MAQTLELPQPSIVRQNVIFRQLPCNKISPWKSHPNRYWHLDGPKFQAWYEDAKSKQADLILVNYSKDKTVDELKAMKVTFMDANHMETSDKKMTRAGYETFKRAMEEKYNVVT